MVATFLFASMASAQAIPPGQVVPPEAIPPDAVAPTPRLGVSYVGAPTITPGVRNIVGAVILDATLSSSMIKVPAIPVAAVFGPGVQPGMLQNCALAPVDALDTPLTTGPNAVMVIGPVNTFTFDRPIAIPPGQVGQLALQCMVNPAPLGASVTLAVTPQQVLAFDVQTGAQIMPTVILNAEGVAQTFSATSVIGEQQPQGMPSVPGVPNAGAGGNAQNTAFALVVAASIVIAGSAYLAVLRRRWVP